jgi:serine/threonine protein kinase
LPLGDAIAVGLVVLEVCAMLQARGWVHTDLHPGNLLLRREVSPVETTVIDFANTLAPGPSGRWTGEVNWGVWDFVPPEQLDDFSTLDASADVYAAASLIAYLIRGTPPLFVDTAALAPHGWDAVRAAYRAAKKQPDLSGIPPQIVPILRSALEENPAQRPPATTLLRRLRHEQIG